MSDPARDLAVAQLAELREQRRLRVEKRLLGALVVVLIVVAAKVTGHI
jgi:hypothetical protein